jgi:cell wall-associated NlpC family hydrolase
MDRSEGRWCPGFDCPFRFYYIYIMEGGIGAVAALAPRMPMMAYNKPVFTRKSRTAGRR